MWVGIQESLKEAVPLLWRQRGVEWLRRKCHRDSPELEDQPSGSPSELS